jgi:hypothetical protein
MTVPNFQFTSFGSVALARRPGVNFADAKLTPCGRNEIRWQIAPWWGARS